LYASYLSCSIGNQCCELLRAPPTLERFGASRSPLAPDLRRTIASDCPLSLSVPPPTGDVVECVLQNWMVVGVREWARPNRVRTTDRPRKGNPEKRDKEESRRPGCRSDRATQGRHPTTRTRKERDNNKLESDRGREESTVGQKRREREAGGEEIRAVCSTCCCSQLGASQGAEEPWQNRTAPLPPHSKALPGLR